MSADTPLIDPEFHALIPPLAPEEFAQLEANIVKDGCRDALVLWKGFNILVDGHNRFAICEQHGLPYKTKELDFETREDVCDWIDANQLGRRNLTPEQQSILRGRRYNRTKKTAAEAGAIGGASRGQKVPCLVSHPAAAALATQYGVTERTIRRDGKRAEFIEELAKVPPAEAQAVRDGKKRIKEVRRTAPEAVKQAEAKAEPKRPKPARKRKAIVYDDTAKGRMDNALSSIDILCAQLGDVKLESVRLACSTEEIRSWVELARTLSGLLSTFACELEKIR